MYYFTSLPFLAVFYDDASCFDVLVDYASTLDVFYDASRLCGELSVFLDVFVISTFNFGNLSLDYIVTFMIYYIFYDFIFTLINIKKNFVCRNFQI